MAIKLWIAERNVIGDSKSILGIFSTQEGAILRCQADQNNECTQWYNECSEASYKLEFQEYQEADELIELVAKNGYPFEYCVYEVEVDKSVMI